MPEVWHARGATVANSRRLTLGEPISLGYALKMISMLKKTPSHAVVLLATLAGAVSSSAGQVGGFGSGYSPVYERESIWNRLEPVDPGIADRGHLGLQTRVLPRPIFVEYDSGLLFRAFTSDGSAIFARRDAGITALFPRSAYAETPLGDFALIPPGTTFVIGEPASSYATGLGLLNPDRHVGDHSGGLRIDGRVDARASGDGRSRSRAEGGASPRRGMAALLRHAGRNERLRSSR